MSEKKEKNYVKDLEYKTHYADGIIVQISNRITRLIFYEEEVQPTEDEREIDKEKKHIKLKF
jgi:hypothetical protein